ncbi:MAG: hypothetical protein QG661_3084, partial [Actinomycetota bacterium]|nr:hypothetical protein [Actinomycetota bacterium]
MSFCTQCGGPLVPGRAHCVQCGARVDPGRPVGATIPDDAISTVEHPPAVPHAQPRAASRRTAIALVTLVGLLVFILVPVAIILLRSAGSATSSPPDTGEKSVEDSRTDSASSSVTPSAPQTGGNPVACSDASLTVEVAATSRTYDIGVVPQFTLSVVNTGSVPCLFNPLPSNNAVVVSRLSTEGDVSGQWPLSECVATETDPRLLQPGERHQSSIAWDDDSSLTECSTITGAPGPGRYTATGRSSQVSSPATAFEIVDESLPSRCQLAANSLPGRCQVAARS